MVYNKGLIYSIIMYILWSTATLDPTMLNELKIDINIQDKAYPRAQHNLGSDYEKRSLYYKYYLDSLPIPGLQLQSHPIPPPGQPQLPPGQLQPQSGQPPTECGLENQNNGMTNIVSGGEEAHANKYPWMVHIVGRKSDGKPSRCGGSIISDTVILTSLHCFTEVQSWEGVKVGVHNVDQGEFQLVKPKEAYWPNTHPNEDMDIGVLIVDPLDLSNKNIGTICLPSGADQNYIGKRVLSLGFGRVTNNAFSSTLREVELTVAQKDMELYMFTEVEQIGGVYQDPCNGDSGGPLMYRNNNKWTVIATAKGGGFNCKTQAISPNYDGLGRWNKLSPHLDWIKCIVEKGGNGCNSKNKKW